MRIKNLFVLGCTVALRVSDFTAMRFTDVETANGAVYLHLRTIKTETPIRFKLPQYAIDIIQQLKKTAGKRKTIIPPLSKNHFNTHIRILAEKAGWTYFAGKSRTKQGKAVVLKTPITKEGYRFCDLLSSHVMRKTAITTLLMYGMPEYIVRKISGHSSNSKAFYRYVHLVQSYLDTNLDKVFNQLSLGTIKNQV